MEHDERAGARAVGLGVGLEPGRVQDERLRLELAQLLLARVDEHRPGEERVVRMVRDDADGDPMPGVGAGEGVHDVEVAAAEVRDGLLSQPVEMLLGDLGVDVAPPDPVLRARLADDELVLRGAAGVLAGVHIERPALGDPPFAALDCMVVEERRRRVPMDGLRRLDAMLSQSDAPALLRARRHRAGHPT